MSNEEIKKFIKLAIDNSLVGNPYNDDLPPSDRVRVDSGIPIKQLQMLLKLMEE